jgi:hypothetical protein
MPQRSRVLSQHDGELTVLDGSFGAVTSKAPFLLYRKDHRKWKERVVIKNTIQVGCNSKVKICAKL